VWRRECVLVIQRRSHLGIYRLYGVRLIVLRFLFLRLRIPRRVVDVCRGTSGSRRIQLVGLTVQQYFTQPAPQLTTPSVHVLSGTPGIQTIEPVSTTVHMIFTLMSLPQTIRQQYSVAAIAYQSSFIIPVPNVVRLTVPTNRLLIRLESRLLKILVPATQFIVGMVMI
jgi:hypothetical protein